MEHHNGGRINRLLRNSFCLRTPVFYSGVLPLIICFLLLSGTLAAQALTADSPFQTHYAANLYVGDTLINISNTGANGASLYGPGFGAPAGNMCVNVYAFAPEEQLISCCSCHVTPNALVSLSAYSDLLTNTLTGVRPTSITIQLIATATGTDPGLGTPSYSGGSSSCVNSAAGAGGLWPVASAGMVAWGTNVHLTSPSSSQFSITESAFKPTTLNASELLSLTSRCAFIIGNGSGFGICRSCTPGARAADKR